MSECMFCNKLKEMIKNKEGIFSKMSKKELSGKMDVVNKALKKIDAEKIQPGWCRGFPLCQKHIETIRRDNKYRVLKGIDIPSSLDTLRMLTDDY